MNWLRAFQPPPQQNLRRAQRQWPRAQRLRPRRAIAPFREATARKTPSQTKRRAITTTVLRATRACFAPDSTLSTIFCNAAWSANARRTFLLLLLSNPLANARGRSAQDSLAEWSKALASGASPQGRGFEPHSCHCVCKHFAPRALLKSSAAAPTRPRRARASSQRRPSNVVWRNSLAMLENNCRALCAKAHADKAIRGQLASASAAPAALTRWERKTLRARARQGDTS